MTKPAYVPPPTRDRIPVRPCCACCKTPGFGCANLTCHCHPKETR